jgi:hypothetical protein
MLFQQPDQMANSKKMRTNAGDVAFTVYSNHKPKRRKRSACQSFNLLLPWMNLDHQGPLVPEEPDRLLDPWLLTVIKLEIKFPDHPRQDNPHLVYRKILTNAVARSSAEGSMNVATVVVERRTRVCGS